MWKSEIRLAWIGLIAGMIYCSFGGAIHGMGMTSAEAAGLPAVWQNGAAPSSLLTMEGDEKENDSDLWDEKTPSQDEPSSDDAEGKSGDIWNEPGGTNGQKGPSDESLWGSDQTGGLMAVEKKSPLTFEGMIRDKLSIDTHEDNELEYTLQNHTEVQLGVKYIPSDRFYMMLSAKADYFAYHRDGDWDHEDSLWLYNAYVNWSGRGYNIKLGNQIVRWGKTDGYSPLDNVNPEDYRDGIAGRREDRKRPIPIMNVEFYFGKLSVQGLYIPVFTSSTFDISGTDWALFQHANEAIPGYRVHEDKPSRTLGNGEVGLRLTGTVRSVDMAVSWLYSRADLPFPETMRLPPGVSLPPGDFKLTDLLQLSRLTGQTVQLSHDWQNIFGFEMESTLGDFGIRADVAYIHKSRFLTRSLQRMDKPECQAMVGIDYNGANAWYTNIQLYQSVILDYDDRIVGANEMTTALIGTISKEFSNGNLKPELRFYYDFSGEASMLNPKILVKFWEPINFEFGAELFDGSVENPIGMFGNNDLIYASVEYKF
jgi:hypothetical protein